MTPNPPLHLAVTGFVSSAAGSMAAANGLLLNALLERGCRIAFFSKSSFVDPRPILGNHPSFVFHEASNPLADRTRKALEKTPLAFPARMWDSATYHRAILQRMSGAHARDPFDLCLWLGDYARGRMAGVPNIAFAQGPPGTDARSILRHWGQIKALTGMVPACKWGLLARLRLSRFGLPPFHFSDHIIVGSRQSKDTLENLFGLHDSRISTLPYPVDLQTFYPEAVEKKPGPLRCLWLGRIVPRKRLDLFLGAAERAISRGIDLQLTIAGEVRLIPEYEKWISSFRYPDRLLWRKQVPREEVSTLIRQHDLLAQPSEEEDFGSSVAEAQACGIPVIVGSTNGNRDYLGPRDLVMSQNSAEALCEALVALSSRREPPHAALISRQTAENHFALDSVADRLLEILETCRSKEKP